MVHAYHCIFGARSFWLPNDPRGSWSDWIRCFELLRYGGATKTDDRRSRAKNPHDHHKRREAKAALKYPPVVFDGFQARAIARGFARACDESGYVLHACSIMPDHVHLVIARHSCLVERVVRHLKGFATMQMNAENIQPLAKFKTKKGETPSPWARDTGWVVYLNTIEDIERSIGYVENNPIREGLPPQRWWFVQPYTV